MKRVPCHVQIEECGVALYRGKEVAIMRKKQITLFCLSANTGREENGGEKEKKQIH